jgi:hypothetical protein
MKFCIDCRHFRNTSRVLGGLSGDCLNPLAANVDPVFGRHCVTAEFARSQPGPCGVDGKLFEISRFAQFSARLFGRGGTR